MSGENVSSLPAPPARRGRPRPRGRDRRAPPRATPPRPRCRRRPARAGPRAPPVPWLDDDGRGRVAPSPVTSSSPAAARRTRCPCPDRRCAPRRCRGAASPATSTMLSPRPRPPSDRSRPWRPCTNRSNTTGSISRRMPMPVSLTATRSISPSRLALTAIGRRIGVYLAALVSRFANTCASRVLSPSTIRPVVDVDRQVVHPLLEQRARQLDRRARSSRRGRRCRDRSEILPRVMRETSSRSSTRRTTWRTWRVDQRPLLLEDAVAAQLHHLQRGQDRRQRIAQLVPEHRQELVLRARGLLGDRARLLGGLPLPPRLQLRLDRAPPARAPRTA